MKKLLFFAVALMLGQLVHAQIEMNSSGSVGLGITPISSYRLYVNGYSYLNSSVGIGVAPISSYKLYVNGYSYLNSSVGIGVAPSGSYKLYVSGYTYLNSSVGIGVAPNADYKLRVSGPAQVNCGAHGASFIFQWNSSGYASLYPSANNEGSIGNSSSAFTTMYAYSFTTVSDARQKENLKDIESPLQTILNLKGLKYDIKKEYSANTDSIKDVTLKEKIEKQRFGHIGFLAQDVQKVLTEAVEYDDVTDVYTMNYSSIIPVLVEAIKEQQLIIEDLAKELKSVIDKNSQKGATTGAKNEQNLLYQNAPNPFSENTKIEYFIVDNTQNAMINIYNMNGTQLNSIQLHQTGSGFITISGGEFTAGMYMYALIADGQVIDTKQMILTE